MNVLFVGLGSIGKRHLKNLHYICRERNIELQVSALRSTDNKFSAEIEKLVNNQIISIKDVSDMYDLVFVTNPTIFHYETLKMLQEKSRFFFIEKPIFDNINYSFSEIRLNSNNVYVAAPIRHSKTYVEFKKLIKRQRIYSVRAICSSYLPDWRKGVDYRNSYSAKCLLGGGVSLDLIHELDYIVDLFGFPTNIYNFKGQYSDLEINSDDLSVYIVKYQDKLCEIHLDYFGREYTRICDVFTKDGIIKADFGKMLVELPSKDIIDCSEDNNACYVNEMNYVLDVMHKRKSNFNTPEHAMQVLKLAIGKNGEM